MAARRERIPEHRVKGKPLGRHVEHDERSKDYPVQRLARPLVATRHKRRVVIFDQGAPLRYRGVDYPDGLGSCTGNAAAGALSTAPFTHRYHESTAVRVYAAATVLDPFPGTFPPDDTGSSGLAVAKVALANGWISRYEHAFTLDAALDALLDGPVITGIDWMDSFDRPVGPDAELVISPGAHVRGGHEMCVVGVDPDKRQILLAQSWGTGFGNLGWVTMSFDTWAALLARRGDVTVFRP